MADNPLPCDHGLHWGNCPECARIHDAELQRARGRIRGWPLEERQFLTTLTEPEVTVIVLAVAVLDLRPDEPSLPSSQT